MKSIDNWYYKNKTAFLKSNILNLGFAQYESDNELGVPALDYTYITDDDLKSTKLIGFNLAKSCKEPDGKAVHFFLHDYQFERVWNYPHRYINVLKRYKFILTPDFSPYGDMPKALWQYNIYRNRWCGKFYQDQGIKVVPTISFGSDEMLEYCLLGVQKNQTIAISTVGEGRWGQYKLLKRNWDRIIDTLQPKNIILFGKDLSSQLTGNIIHKKSKSVDYKE